MFFAYSRVCHADSLNYFFVPRTRNKFVFNFDLGRCSAFVVPFECTSSCNQRTTACKSFDAMLDASFVSVIKLSSVRYPASGRPALFRYEVMLVSCFLFLGCVFLFSNTHTFVCVCSRSVYSDFELSSYTTSCKAGLGSRRFPYTSISQRRCSGASTRK